LGESGGDWKGEEGFEVLWVNEETMMECGGKSEVTLARGCINLSAD